MVEDVLHVMGQTIDRLKAQEGRQPFDGMDRAKDVVNPFRVWRRRRVFEREQVLLDAGQMLDRLGDKLLNQLRIFMNHSGNTPAGRCRGQRSEPAALKSST